MPSRIRQSLRGGGALPQGPQLIAAAIVVAIVAIAAYSTIGGRDTPAEAGSEPTAVTDDPPTVVYYNDFSDPLGPEWDIYESIGHAGWGLRRPSAVSITEDPAAEGGRLLTITAQMGTGDEAGQLVSGGMKLLKPQTYGRYTVRARVDADPAQVTSGAVLLWPRSNEWPEGGEIDILETWANRTTRTPVESNLHWLDADADPPYDSSDDDKTQRTHPGIDGTEWHTYVLDWRADLISISVDGGEPVVMSTDPAEISDWDMELTVQLDAFDAPDRQGLQPSMDGSVSLHVDYIKVES